MTADHLELFLKWRASGENPRVQAWLEQRGLSTTRLKQGLLISGNRENVEKAFSVSLSTSQVPAPLPVPEDLAPYVASITLPKPRSYHD